MYDAIIVGARCAGSPTAMLLARKGYRVLLLDRDTFPSDTMSTHLVWHEGVDHLARWGLLDEVRATNCPPITRVMVDFGNTVLSGTPQPVGGATAAYCPRRRLLDTILVQAAIKAGAELREGFTVHELSRDGDSVTGVRGRTAGGQMIEEQARIVVGADGFHSAVARLVEAPEYETVPALSCGYYSYFSGARVEDNQVYFGNEAILYIFPTNDGLTCIAAEWPQARFHEVRADIEGSLRRQIDRHPALAERLKDARREEPWAGTGEMRNFFRHPYGPSWALAGDAGYHKDPVTGRGISDGFRDAEFVASAIDDGLSGRVPLEEALAGYEQRRNQLSMPMYQLTLQFLTFAPLPPEMEALVGAVSRSQAETDRFLGLVPGGTSIPEYFAPEHLQQVMLAAGQA